MTQSNNNEKNNKFSKPSNIHNLITKEILFTSVITAYIFSLSIYLIFISVSYLLNANFDDSQIIVLLLTGSATIFYLIFIPFDRFSKKIWIILSIPSPIIFLGLIINLFQGNGLNPILILLIIFLLPVMFTSISTLSFCGYYIEVQNRGKVNSITVFFLFGMVALSTFLKVVFYDIGIDLGLVFYAIFGFIVIIPIASILKSERFLYILKPHSSVYFHSIEKKQIKKYLIMLFFYKICLGMLVSVIYDVPSNLLTTYEIWLIIGVTALIITPLLGILTDKIGRKNIFNFSCAVLAITFGFLALNAQSLTIISNWSSFNVIIFSIFIGITYPAMLVSEYSIFHDFSKDDSRLIVIAEGLFTHIGGICVGILVGYIFISPGLSYFLLATNLLTIGLFITSTAEEPLPKKEELLWRDAMRHLYIFHSEAGLSFCDYSFVDENKTNEELIAGGLTGISTMINEITKRSGNLKVIEQQNANILFDKGKFITVALISNANLNILHEKIHKLVVEFEELFYTFLEKFNGNVMVFQPANVLVKRIFS